MNGHIVVCHECKVKLTTKYSREQDMFWYECPVCDGREHTYVFMGEEVSHENIPLLRFLKGKRPFSV